MGNLSNYDRTVDQLNQAGMGYKGLQPYYNNAAQAFEATNPAYQQAAQAYQSQMPAYQNAAAGYNRSADFLNRTAGHQAVAGQQAFNAFGRHLNAGDVANNQYVQDMNKQTAKDLATQFSEQLLPAINQGGQKVNALGGSRHGLAQAVGMGKSQDALARALTETNLGAYRTGMGIEQNARNNVGTVQAGMAAPGRTLAEAAKYRGIGADLLGKGANAMSQGAGMLTKGAQGLQQGAGLRGQGVDQLAMAGKMFGNAATTGNQAAQIAMQTGQVPELYQDRVLRDAMERFRYQYQEPYQRMNMMTGLLGFFNPLGTQYGAGASYGTGGGIGPNPNYQSIPQALFGGAASGAALGGMGASKGWWG
jgi:hypothetical protein